ncbi:Halocyanin [Halorubrum sp. DM2]|nr:Halocyanin [Halorubrum sp. DM2]
MDDLETLPADDYPLVGRWLDTDEVGGADDTFNGTIVDARGLDNPEITVGAEGNGGPVAFDPSAVIISPETVVKWVWTAHGHHNVVSDPNAQLGESNRAFSSGEIVERENNLHTEVFDEAGTVLYQCEPHLDLGMKGALVVDSQA